MNNTSTRHTLICVFLCSLLLGACGGGGGESSSSAGAGGNTAGGAAGGGANPPPVNRAPIASTATVAANEDVVLNGTLPAASDPDGDAVTYAVATPATRGLVQISADGSYSYQPIPTLNGSDSFSYRVSDTRGGSNTYIVQVNVAPVNDAPVRLGAPFAFGLGDGVVKLTVDPAYDDTRGIALQADGKILVSGSSFVAGRGSVLVLARFRSDGTLDSGFGGGNGVVVTLNAGGGSDAVVQPDGKILVSGCSFFCGSTSVQFALARYTADGILDTGFGGGDGIATVALGQTSQNFVQGDTYSVVLQGDGKALVAGYTYNGSNQDFAIVRFNTDGSLDSGFGGGDGIVISPIGAEGDVGYDLALQTDGRILVAGVSKLGANLVCSLARYTTSGLLDTAFGGGDGTVVVPLGNSPNSCLAIDVASDGKLVVTGSAVDDYSLTGENMDISLIRFNADGSLDSSLVGAAGPCPISNPSCRPLGVVFTPIGSGRDDLGNDLKILANNKIVVAGASVGADSLTVLTRYNANGTLDSTFGGGDGIVTTNLSTSIESAEALAVQVDGKMLVAVDLPGTELAVARYNVDGSLDSTFGKKNRVLEGTSFVITLPAGRFVDQDGDLLTITATLADGSPLPAWLAFNPVTLTFTGLAPVSAPDLQLRVRAADPGGLFVLDEFALVTLAP